MVHPVTKLQDFSLRWHLSRAARNLNAEDAAECVVYVVREDSKDLDWNRRAPSKLQDLSSHVLRTERVVDQRKLQTKRHYRRDEKNDGGRRHFC
jgi:hypothetical protein